MGRPARIRRLSAAAARRRRWIGRGFGSIKDSGTLCLFLLEKAQLKLVPGGAFGGDKGVRISYVAALSTLQDEMEKIKEATTLLKQRVAV
ncbi:bifunctional aspartate aminotransferase and glutamate/aspartate-prephenate aminotransferase-like isoform X3 [Lolium rigidum]|uniref:bifunctional aspartate aminotransferase and glutamate/aspartate-prephenate aminotransferase-like isoform X3 n=1 Tax=Lolium rigidum TaxID=89674 RepID=UPI001F5D329F|nr:bifunctional aspartate aminotransferase and glutamate/aspartate-prephenate aminotransferase-like isoform X3 [Lolium rigidum]